MSAAGWFEGWHGACSCAHPIWLGYALVFCAGTFLCIACADLLPELQFHSHDRLKLSLALLAGLAIAVAITRFGPAEPGHDHALISTVGANPSCFVTFSPLAAR